MKCQLCNDKEINHKLSLGLGMDIELCQECIDIFQYKFTKRGLKGHIKFN